MLIEIFNNKIYEETVSDLELGIKSKRVPSVTISEDGSIVSKYLKVAQFLLATLDNEYYKLSEGGHFMLEVEPYNVYSDDCSTISVSKDRPIREYKFMFKFNSLNSNDDPKYSKTIHGDVTIDEDLNIIKFDRDKITERNTRNTTIPICDVRSSSSPFDLGCQQAVPTDNRDSEGAGSITTKDSNDPIIELSENSFSAGNGILDVSHPEMKIGSVQGPILSIDADKQRQRDEFLKTISAKMINRNHKRTK